MREANYVLSTRIYGNFVLANVDDFLQTVDNFYSIYAIQFVWSVVSNGVRSTLWSTATLRALSTTVPNGCCSLVNIHADLTL